MSQVNTFDPDHYTLPCDAHPGASGPAWAPKCRALHEFAIGYVSLDRLIASGAVRVAGPDAPRGRRPHTILVSLPDLARHARRRTGKVRQGHAPDPAALKLSDTHVTHLRPRAARPEDLADVAAACDLYRADWFARRKARLFAAAKGGAA